METINRALISYGVNALWQIPLIAAMASVAARFLRHAPERYVRALWCAALVTALVAADPSNVNARLYLATACIRQFAAVPGAERVKIAPADSPLVTCAVRSTRPCWLSIRTTRTPHVRPCRDRAG